MAGPMLSSRIHSAPAPAASIASSRSRASASTFDPGWRLLARRTATPMPPAMSAWFSLTSIAAERSKRWLFPPPSSTALFSNHRKPGVVLRVAATSTCGFAARTFATAFLVAVAIPLIRITMLRASRSHRRSAAASPVASSTFVPGDTRLPSRTVLLTRHRRSRKSAAASSRPATTHASFARRAACAAVRPKTALVVTSPRGASSSRKRRRSRKTRLPSRFVTIGQSGAPISSIPSRARGA